MATPDRRRAWYLRNRARILAERRADYVLNPDKYRERRAADYARNRKKRIADEQRKRHGPQVSEAWAALWTAQGGRCYLGGEELVAETAVIDHDHACCPSGRSCSLCRRGLACLLCNVVIGQAGDSPARLRRIADALEVAQQAFEQRKSTRAAQDSLFPELGEECA